MSVVRRYQRILTREVTRQGFILPRDHCEVAGRKGWKRTDKNRSRKSWDRLGEKIMTRTRKY